MLPQRDDHFALEKRLVAVHGADRTGRMLFRMREKRRRRDDRRFVLLALAIRSIGVLPGRQYSRGLHARSDTVAASITRTGGNRCQFATAGSLSVTTGSAV